MTVFYNCPHCNRKYKKINKYELHVKQHNGENSTERIYRNYDTEPRKTGKKLFKCPVSGCNRKYKSKNKVKRHTEEKHFYETRKSGSYRFDSEDKIKIYTLAADYAKVLCRVSTMTENEVINAVESFSNDYMIFYAKNLLPQKYNKKISTKDMIRISIAQHKFSLRVFDNNLFDSDWTIVIKDLEDFLNLGLPYYDTNFCPTLPIDFLWHALMQNPELYSKICNNICNEIIPHCMIERSELRDTKRYEYFLQVFKHNNKRDVYIPPDYLQDNKDNISKIQKFRYLCLGEKRLQDERFEEKRLRDERNKKLTDERFEEKRLYNEREKRLRDESKSLEERVQNERYKIEMKDFSEKANVNVSNYNEYVYNYLPLYEAGYTGQILEINAEKLKQFNIINRSINRRNRASGLGSSC